MILFLAADTGGGRIAFDREHAGVDDELKRSPFATSFDLQSKWAVRADDVFGAVMQLEPTILHFTGQGLIFVGEEGPSQAVDAATLTEMIRTTSKRVRLVVLNASDSEAHAQALLDVVDCAIGMAGEISDEDAHVFARGFYRALGHCRSVENAFEQAKAALGAHGLAGVPRCLARPGVDLASLHLCEPEPRPAELFLSHPAAGRASASALYQLLDPDVRVFLSTRSIEPGARGEDAAPEAQQRARATVLLIPSHAGPAWYLGDEVLAAIALHRALPAARRLVVVRLEPGATVPCGLGAPEVIDAASLDGIPGVARELRALAKSLRRRPLIPATIRRFDAKQRAERFRLYERLSRLTEATFEQIAVSAKLDRAAIGARTAPLADRVISAAQLASLDPALGRRITLALDQQVPWTARR